MIWRLFLILLFILGCTHQGRYPAQFDITPPTCLDGLNLFSSYVEKTHKGLYDIAVKIRSKAKPSDARVGHEVKINKQNYKLLSLLGTSNSSVYLAKNLDGKLFSVKMDSLVGREDFGQPNWLAQTWLYEKFKTKFYEIKKLPVAHIHELDATTESPTMIKEYIFGLTYDEIKNNKGLFPPNVASNIMVRLRDTMQEFRAVEKDFIPWLKDNFFDPARTLSGSALGQTQILIERGDVAERNFVYDVVREKWVCIDP
jgi:hypothetical protein